MNFLISGLFWGSVLILIGLSIIIRITLNINIPVFSIVIGVLLIYFGIQVLFGSPFRISRREVRSVKGQYREEMKNARREVRSARGLSKANIGRDGNEYNIIFSSGTIDLSELKELAVDSHIIVNVVFGSAIILIDQEMTVNIQSNTVFGETVLPENTITIFGENTTKIGNPDEEALFQIELNTVFGSSEIKWKK